LNILQRYIFRRVVVLSIASFVAVLIVVWVTQILSRIDFAIVTGASLAAFFRAVVLMTPALVGMILPISIVIGMVQVLNTMNADSEMPVISSAGMSRMMVAKPILVTSAIASILVLLSSHFVEPQSLRGLRNALVSMRTDLVSNFLREGTFTKLDENLTIYIDRNLPGNVLSGIMVSDTRDPATELIYYAQTGVVTEIDGNDVVVMTNGQIHRENVKDGSVSVIRFNSYAISLSQFGSTATTASYYPPMEHDTIELLNPDPESFYAKKSPDWLRTEFHRRMTDWLHPILYGLIALVVAGQTRSHRQNSFNTFFLAVGATLLYKGAAYAAYGVARHDSGLAWILYAIPLGGIVLSAGMYLNGITVAAPDRIARVATELFDAVRRFRIRHARARTT